MLTLVAIFTLGNFLVLVMLAQRQRSIRISLLSLRRCELWARRRSASLPAIVAHGIKTTFDVGGTTRLLELQNTNLEEQRMLLERIHERLGLS